MDLFKAALLLARLFGAIWFVVGIVWIIVIIVGFFLLPRVEEIYGVLAQYFVYGILDVIAGLVLLLVARPLAKFVARKL
jgi:hypothetical protein